LCKTSELQHAQGPCSTKVSIGNIYRIVWAVVTSESGQLWRKCFSRPPLQTHREMTDSTMVATTRAPYAAVIFGWWGSGPRSLQRYEDLHKGLGAVQVVSLTCSTDEMLDPKKARPALLKADVAFTGSMPVVVHVFSNGGMILYRQFFRERPEVCSKVSAVVFDSTPGSLTISAFIGAATATAPAIVRHATTFLPLGAVAILYKLVGRRPKVWVAIALLMLVGWLKQRKRNSEYFEMCASDPVVAPSLFLYSSSDRLVDFRVVERLVAERRRRITSKDESIATQHVRARRWENTAHVAHCKAKPSEYRGEVEILLQDALVERK